MFHDLKIWPEYFQAVKDGSKPFEVREVRDRNFQVGDVLVLHEWRPDTEAYTGECVNRRVTYVLEGGVFGVAKGYVVMGLSNE